MVRPGQINIISTMYKISIIIPVFNVEQYLRQCLKSIISQTYDNLQIILINDGATDSSPQICNEYAASDSRIIVIHKTNGGLSDARNAGLKVASGDIISFVDSDDLLSQNFYSRMIQALSGSNADIVECNYIKFQEEAELAEIESRFGQPAKLFDTGSALISLMNEELKQVVWNKIYKADVLSNLEFPVNKINEDEYWTYKVFGNAGKILKIPDTLYFYRQQEGSIMGKPYSLRRLDGLQALEERVQYMKENYPNLVNLAVKKLCFAITFHYQMLTINQKIDPEMIFRKKLKDDLNLYNKFSIISTWHWKEIIWFQLFKWSPAHYMKLRNVIDARVQKRKKKI